MSKNQAKHTDVDLHKIRENLPYRYMDKIRLKLDKPNLSDALISQVMNEKRKDHHGIIKTAIAIIKEQEQEKKRTIEEYNEIFKS